MTVPGQASDTRAFLQLDVHGGVQVGSCTEQADRFLDVAPGGDGADLEAGCEAGVGVGVAQMRQGE